MACQPLCRFLTKPMLVTPSSTILAIISRREWKLKLSFLFILRLRVLYFRDRLLSASEEAGRSDAPPKAADSCYYLSVSN
jgi:hypothetical protein